MENKLPKNWVETKLKDLGTYINGRTFKAVEWKNKGLPIIRIQNLNNNKACFNYSNEQFDEKFKVKNGDLLMAWSASLGVYFWKGGDAWLNQHIFKVVNNDKIIHKNFLYYCLLISIEDFYSKTHGSGIVHITKPTFENHQVPLPPLPEQERIVAKLDALFAQHEAMKKALERIPQLLKDFRQQVLVQAVTGILTENWRINKNLENVSEFSRFYSNKRKEDFTKLSEEAKKKKLSKPRTYANLENVKILEHERINTKKAENWIIKPISWISNSEESSIVDGPFGSSINVEKDYVETGVPVIRMINIRPFTFISENLKFLKEEKFKILQRHNILENDVLLAKVGATIGDCCLYPEGSKEAILSTTGSCRIRVDNNVMLNKFLVIYLTKNKNILKSIASETAQPFLNMKTIKAFPIVIPPLEEQQEIVSRVESFFAKADIIEKRYKTLKEKIDSLPQAILHKAFKGELVPQLPTDGDAKDLLEEIIKLKKEVKKK